MIKRKKDDLTIHVLDKSRKEEVEGYRALKEIASRFANQSTSSKKKK